MQAFTRIVAMTLCLILAGTTLADVPQMISYQGKISVGGKLFTGTGQFKFALVDANGNNLWTNDGTSIGTAQPPAGIVSVTVSNAIYSVLLGNAASGMAPISPGIFANNPGVKLRTWFNDGTNGMQQLSPDYPLASVPYAMLAAKLPCNAVEPCNLGAGTVSGEVLDCTGEAGNPADVVVYAGGTSAVSIVKPTPPHTYELTYVPAGTQTIVAWYTSGHRESAEVSVAPGARIDGVNFVVGGTQFYRDADEDGFGDAGNLIHSCDPEPMGGYVDNALDCDDTDPQVFGPEVCNVPGGIGACSTGLRCPGEPCVSQPRQEMCDGIDNDCDGVTDEDAEDATIYYRDADDDGYGIASQAVTACEPRPGYAPEAGDCNDSNDRMHPRLEESCDGLDNDCDDETDEDFGLGSACSNGIGACMRSGALVCSPDGLEAVCNAVEGQPSPETCDGTDNDCDGVIDEDPVDATTYYRDADEDGYGVASEAITACQPPLGYSHQAGDCNDFNFLMFPGNPERCDGMDNDCDGVVDEDAVDMSIFYRDADADTFGVESQAVMACGQPAGYVTEHGDCNDANHDIFPGGWEMCNGEDDDCDGMTDEDFAIGSACSKGIGACMGVGVFVCSPDGYEAICTAQYGQPSAEICDGIDNDCDGATDEGELCSDGNPCNGYETCGAAAGCQPGTPPVCDDGVACTTDICNPISGCVSTPNDTLCNDANPDTVDHCGATTGCENTFSCTTGAKDGRETDVDCGGGTCPACADGKLCMTSSDCQSHVCQASRCAAASCTDGIRNANETDLDCGGGACPKCANSKHCNAASDCVSNNCVAGICQP